MGYLVFKETERQCRKANCPRIRETDFDTVVGEMGRHEVVRARIAML